MPPRSREGLQEACYGAYEASCENDTATVEVFVQRVIEAASQRATKVWGAVDKAKQTRIMDSKRVLEVDLSSVNCSLVPIRVSNGRVYSPTLRTIPVRQHQGSSRLQGSTVSLAG